MRLTIPAELADACRQDGREAWLAGLPAVAEDIADRWGLTLGPPFEPGGQTAWVAPAGAGSVLKLAWRHPEADHEADGLRAWGGAGAVRLLRAAEVGDTAVLLLERCVPGAPLATSVPEPDQDAVVAGLLRRLWRAPPAGVPFRSLAEMCDEWAASAAAKRPTIADPGIVRAGLALFRSLPRDADRSALLVTDLHAGNVLAAEREPWLMIDPKPHVGDPAYDPLQHILNCDARLRADPRALADRMADLLDLDRARLARWLFARCVQESPDWPALGEVALRLAPR